MNRSRIFVTSLLATSSFALAPAAVEALGDEGLARQQNQQPPARLVWVDRAGNVGEAIGEPQAMVTGPSISPDAMHIAVRERVDGNDDIYIHDLRSGTKTRFTSHEASDMHPKWSPSADRIAFFTYRNGLADVYVRAVSGDRAEVPLANGPLHEYYPDWSPDGRSITYHSHDPETNARDVWTMSTDGGEPVAVVSHAGREGLARISPDGRAMAYQSDESGQWEIYVVTFPEGQQQRKVSTGGGLWPKWASDGELFFFSNDTLMVSKIDTGQSLGAGAPEALFTTEQVGMPDPSSSQFNALYDVTPDGQRFVVVQR